MYSQNTEEDQRSPEQFVLSDDEQRDGEPMLFVDVNLGNSGTQRIVIFEGDTAEMLAKKFARKHNLDENMQVKLVSMLEQQIAAVLPKIDEEEHTSEKEEEEEDRKPSY